MSPEVTVGIPCHNAVNWIEGSIRSALDQGPAVTDIVVVDDGSNDGSRQVIERYADQITFLTTDHRGANHARNAVLQVARGEWVQYLDADDYLFPGKISAQLEEVDAGSADVIYSPTFEETWSGGDCRGRRLLKIDDRLDLCSQWLLWLLPQTGGALWRRQTLLKLGGWNESMPCCQEHELYLRAIKANARFAFAPTPNAVYRIWSEETLCRQDPEHVVRRKSALVDNLIRWMVDVGRWSRRHHRLAGQVYFEMCRTLAKYNVDEAVEYHRKHRDLGLIRLCGPAAPWKYRILYSLLGFKATERIAAATR